MVNDLTITGWNFSVMASPFRIRLGLWKHDHIRLGLAARLPAHSMHRRALAPLVRHAVTLGAQLLKDFQHRRLGRVKKGPLGDGGGLLQQLFRFVHETTLALCS